MELAEKLQPLIGVEAFTNELGETGGGQPSMSVEEFLAVQEEEIEELVSTPFGAMLLFEIGLVYASKSKVWLGKHAESSFSREYLAGGWEDTKIGEARTLRSVEGCSKNVCRLRLQSSPFSQA
eukprot:SAG11_NODE_387_length_9883_cov_9.365699_4_plen_123_part_00